VTLLSGSPGLVLAPSLSTVAVAALLVGLHLAAVRAFRSRVALAARPVGVAAGVGFALVGVGAWVAVQASSGGIGSSPASRLPSGAFWVAFAAFQLAAQAGFPVAWLDGDGLRAPVVGHVVAGTVALVVLLQPGGDVDPIGTYAVSVGPLALVGVAVLAGGERVARGVFPRLDDARE
jgi:hypothetical protein